MRSYAELEKEYQTAKRKAPKGAEQAAKLFYIGGQFLEDHKISMLPLEDLTDRAAAALQDYPQEERQRFAEAVQYICSTLKAIQNTLNHR